MNLNRELAFFFKRSLFSSIFVYNLPICLLFLFLGFFSTTLITSILACTKNLLVLIAFLMTLFVEFFGAFFYKFKKDKQKVFESEKTVFFYFNYLKIGLIFGLFIDAFKLGS